MAAFTPTNNPTFPRQPRRWYCQMTSTVGVVLAYPESMVAGTPATAGPNGSKIRSIIVTSTDIDPQPIIMAIVNSTTNVIVNDLVAVTIPAQAGTLSGTPSIDIMAEIDGLPRDEDGPYILLNTNENVGCQALALTVGKHINVMAFGFDF